MARTEITVHLIPGERREGLWCETCALPSRIEQDVHSMTPAGVSTMTVGRCSEHGFGPVDDD